MREGAVSFDSMSGTPSLVLGPRPISRPQIQLSTTPRPTSQRKKTMPTIRISFVRIAVTIRTALRGAFCLTGKHRPAISIPPSHKDGCRPLERGGRAVEPWHPPRSGGCPRVGTHRGLYGPRRDPRRPRCRPRARPRPRPRSRGHQGGGGDCDRRPGPGTGGGRRRGGGWRE